MTATDRLDSLVSVYLAGRGAPGGPAPEDLCRECPELLPELRRRISAADFAAALLGSNSGGAEPGADTGPLALDADRDTAPAGAGGVGAGALRHAFPEYEIQEVLGAGGMGVVYRARDVRLNRAIALKVIGGRAEPGQLIRFLAEAEAAAAVVHPHVVQVHAYGEHAGRPFIALELCPGGSLADRLRSGPWPDPREAAALVAKVAAGVAAAHDAGIVHRDLKPGNVLLDAAGEPKVADFGLAKRATNELTRTQAVMGTPYYTLRVQE